MKKDYFYCGFAKGNKPKKQLKREVMVRIPFSGSTLRVKCEEIADKMIDSISQKEIEKFENRGAKTLSAQISLYSLCQFYVNYFSDECRMDTLRMSHVVFDNNEDNGDFSIYCLIERQEMWDLYEKYKDYHSAVSFNDKKELNGEIDLGKILESHMIFMVGEESEEGMTYNLDMFESIDHFISVWAVPW